MNVIVSLYTLWKIFY